MAERDPVLEIKEGQKYIGNAYTTATASEFIGYELHSRRDIAEQPQNNNYRSTTEWIMSSYSMHVDI